MGKLEAGIKLAFPYTGGHFLCLVALIIPNPLKCSFSEKRWGPCKGEFRPTDLWGACVWGMEKRKKDTRQHQEWLTQDSSTWLQALFAWLPPSTGKNSVWQILTSYTSQCPGALTCTTLYIQNCLSSEQRSSASSSASTCSTPRQIPWWCLSARCRQVPWWCLSCRTEDEVGSS